MENNKKKIISGLFWSFGERILAQIVSTIVTIVLARLLTPEHYGMVAIVVIFINISNVFVTSGFGSAIVQKKNVERIDYNTAFWLSFIIAIILYIFLFITAPLISGFYKMIELKYVIRVMALRLPLASINTIQQACIRHEMKFKKFFLGTLFGTVFSGIIGVFLAIKGFGVWALVTQYLTNTFIDTVVLSFISGWNPKIEYSRDRAKKIFSFGWKILMTDLISTLESNLRSLIIGKVFTAKSLAYYDQGMKYPSLLVNNINVSINKVMLPAYAQHQDNIVILKNMLRKSIQIGMYILAPTLIGFAVVAPNFVKLILTEKWISSVPFLQIFCIIYIFRPLETSCHQAILSIGKSDIILKIMLVINSVALISVFIAVFILKKVFFIAIGSLISTLISVILFMCLTNKHLKYKFLEQISDIFESVFISVIMGIVVLYIGKYLNLSLLFLLLFQIVVGVIVYIICSILFRNKTYFYLLEFFKQQRKKNERRY